MKETTKKTASQILSDFITNQRKVLFTVLVVVVSVIIILGVWSGVKKNNNEKMVDATIELVDLSEKLARGEVPSEDFIKYANEVIESYKGQKAELLAYSKLAGYYFDNKDFEKALDFYTLAYTNFPKDMANSVYMFNAAMALDELGKTDESIKVLEWLVSKFKVSDINKADKSADVPEAIFNLGRLYESKGNTKKAIENYEILVAEYQNYNLANLAKSRLISIK